MSSIHSNPHRAELFFPFVAFTDDQDANLDQRLESFQTRLSYTLAHFPHVIATF